jgi:hypothetical protein
MLLQLGEVDDLVHRADILRDIEENSTYITPDLLGDAGERLFALGFTLEQLRRNFEDLKQCAKTMRNQSWAGRETAPSASGCRSSGLPAHFLVRDNCLNRGGERKAQHERPKVFPSHGKCHSECIKQLLKHGTMPSSLGCHARTKIHNLVPQHPKLCDQNRLDPPRFRRGWLCFSSSTGMPGSRVSYSCPCQADLLRFPSPAPVRSRISVGAP